MISKEDKVLRYLQKIISNDVVNAPEVISFYNDFPDNRLAMVVYAFVESSLNPQDCIPQKLRDFILSKLGHGVVFFKDINGSILNELITVALIDFQEKNDAILVDITCRLKNILLSKSTSLKIAGGTSKDAPVESSFGKGGHCDVSRCSELLSQQMAMLNRVQKYIDRSEKPVMAFTVYSRVTSPDEWFRAIAQMFEKEYTIICFTDLPSKDITMPGKVFTFSPELIKKLSNIKFLFQIDAYSFECSQHTLSIGFFHAFYVPYSSAHYAYCRADLNFDVFCINEPDALLDKGFIQEAHSNRRNPQNILRNSKYCTWASVGYPRLGVLYHKMKKYRGLKPSTILYAPATYRWGGCGDYSDPKSHMVERYGEKILSSLLESFPEYEIVYRPCIDTINHAYTTNLIERFKNHPRFRLSTVTDHEPEFSKAAMVVTDYSSIAEVFSLSCLRPELRLTYEPKNGFITRHYTGYEVNVEDDYITVAKEMLSLSDEYWERQITSAFDQYIVHPQKFFPRIRALIDSFSTEEELPFVVKTSRDNTLPHWTCSDYLKRIFFHENLDYQLSHQFHVDFANSISLALNLYIFFRTIPHQYCGADDTLLAIELGCGDIVPYRFADLTPQKFTAIAYSGVQCLESDAVKLARQLVNYITKNWLSVQITSFFLNDETPLNG